MIETEHVCPDCGGIAVIQMWRDGFRLHCTNCTRKTSLHRSIVQAIRAWNGKLIELVVADD